MRTAKEFVDELGDIFSYVELDPMIAVYEAKGIIECICKMIYEKETKFLSDEILMIEIVAEISENESIPEDISVIVDYLVGKTKSETDGHKHVDVHYAKAIVHKMDILMEWFLNNYYDYNYMPYNKR
jgi:hypothetical protein